jgi:hypothetical protein
MRISAPGDCNQAFRQSSGAFAVQIGLLTIANDRGNPTSFQLMFVPAQIAVRRLTASIEPTAMTC